MALDTAWGTGIGSGVGIGAASGMGAGLAATKAASSNTTRTTDTIVAAGGTMRDWEETRHLGIAVHEVLCSRYR